MRVTKSRLLQIIREEVRSAVVDQGLEDELVREEEEIESEEGDLPLPPKVSGIDNPAEKRKFKKAFLDTYTDYKSMSPRPTNFPKEIRIGPEAPGAKVTPDIAKKLIQDLGYEVQQEILPGGMGSCSGKGCTYVVAATNDSPPFSVVFGSANKGESFEAALRDDLATGSGPLGDELLSSLGMTRADVQKIDPPLPARARPLTGQIRDDGQAISDITIHTSGGPMYISLKDPTGGTFANNGVAGMFVDTADGFIPGEHPLDDFVSALGVDKMRVALGASDYKMMRDTPPERCEVVTPDTFDGPKIANYLASALGYGYVYARKQTKGGYHIERLETEEDARALVGMPTNINIIYARFCNTGKSKSKGTRVIVDTDNGARYEVAIRNKSGKIVPNQMTISIKGYPTSSIHETYTRRAFERFLKF